MEAETTWVPSKNVADFTQVRVKSLYSEALHQILLLLLYGKCPHSPAES